MLRAITHPTDFSPESDLAFVHALKFALLARCPLDILHVKTAGGADAWESFPRVREVLHRWGLMAADEPASAIEARCGVRVAKVEIGGGAAAADGIQGFVARHRTDLVVAATHARGGLPGWLAGSVSGSIALKTRVPTLFLRAGMRQLVDPESGVLNLRTILAPVDASPSPNEPLQVLRNILETIGVAPEIRLLHIGQRPPEVTSVTSPIHVVDPAEGSVVQLIARDAEACGADLIVMPTAGHDGFLDAFRGSMTERVLREAGCPVLAVSAA
jgi:nucleotide-binding universal stress UspA family protein